MDAKTKQELLIKIEEAIDNIRPYLEADGGDVKLLDIDDNYVVLVELLGACEACPMSPMTMKAVIATIPTFTDRLHHRNLTQKWNIKLLCEFSSTALDK